MVAQELGKEAKFQDMQFGSILASVQSGMVDAAIATITITEERKKSFDFSDPYYVESLAIVYQQGQPLKNKDAFFGKKIICQLGTTMEIWLKKHALNTEIVTVDNNLQAIEALKAGHVDGVFIDTVQAKAFSKKNPQLSYEIIVQADTGYGIAFKKGSLLKEQVNKALTSLAKKGVIKKLKNKYLENGK